MRRNILEAIVYKNNPVRIRVINGKPWFAAKDICNILEISNPRKAVAALDNDEKGVTNSDTPGGKQALNIINESGMYALIFRSRKPVARAFRKWVTMEVLPSIHKYGRYVMPGSKEQLRLDRNIEHKERISWLNSISVHLTETDHAQIAAKAKCDKWDVRAVLDGNIQDISIEA